MAKLDELKRLMQAKRADGQREAAPDDATGTSTASTPGTYRKELVQRAQRVISSKRAIAGTKHAEGDIDLAKAFADVRRLPPSTRARIERPRPAPVAAQRIADEREVLLQSKYGDEPAPHTWEIGQELEAGQTFVRPGLGTDVLGKLRRGHWSLQGELDLHGHTSDQARDALADFLYEARQRGYRCVRVVHGKGLTSPNREPVLKGKVRKWLAHWDDVLAYSEAPRHAGGGGAVLILLRGK
ncbi:MAG: Smr/MutS family protein [Pseudomonadota bacterium]|nr:Smr/MutS family protein [Pseudomonadota bacterium]